MWYYWLRHSQRDTCHVHVSGFIDMGKSHRHNELDYIITGDEICDATRRGGHIKAKVTADKTLKSAERWSLNTRDDLYRSSNRPALFSHHVQTEVSDSHLVSFKSCKSDETAALSWNKRRKKRLYYTDASFEINCVSVWISACSVCDATFIEFIITGENKREIPRVSFNYRTRSF